jgi:hypothetical protein
LKALLRRVQSAEPVDAIEEIVGDAVHDLARLAVHEPVEPGEIGDAARRAHAAEEAVALDQQHVGAVPCGGGGGGDPGGAAAEHHHFVLGEDFGGPPGLADHLNATPAARARAATGRCR